MRRPRRAPDQSRRVRTTRPPNRDARARRVHGATSSAYSLTGLTSHPARGYRASELAAELNMPRGSVGTTLSQLEERGLVRHRSTDWAIDPDACDAHTASAIGLETVAKRIEGDYYDQHPDWDAELPDLDDDPESD